MPACADCGMDVNPERAGTWVEVQAWVKQRKGGGFHGISLPTFLGTFLCNACMAVRKNQARRPTIHPGQLTMFPDE
jgi:hypothetical protein